MAQKIQLGTKLSAVAANGAEATRTFTQAVGEFAKVALTYSIDHTAATKIHLQIYLSADGGTSWGRVQASTLAAGVDTQEDYSTSNDVSGDESIWVGPIDCSCATHIKVIASTTGGGADDKLTIVGSAEL